MPVMSWASLCLVSEILFNRVMKKLEVHVIELAEWSYSEVVQAIIKLEEGKTMDIFSFDGFYQTRGHYSNISSAPLHDHTSGPLRVGTIRPSKQPLSLS